MDLNDISKKDKYWRNISLAICKDKNLSDDIVQEMYLKVFELDKEITDYYVIIIIKNLFLDYCRKKNYDTSLDEVYNLSIDNSIYEINDDDYFILQKANNLKWWRKKLLEENYDKSLREIEKEFKINYGFIYRELVKARKEILGEKYNKKYNNKRFKNYAPKK